MHLCAYGCGREGRHYLKNVDKWICEPNWQSCPKKKEMRSQTQKGKPTGFPPWNKGLTKDNDNRINEISKKLKNVKKGPMSNVVKEKIRDAQKNIPKTEEHKQKIRLKLERIQKRYPFFCKVEKPRENPETGEIEVRCKQCGTWFTPTYWQLYNRRKALEKPLGYGESHFYCSQRCKDRCSIFNIKIDPNIKIDSTEMDIPGWLRKRVLERDNRECVYCETKTKLRIHHIHPQKIRPDLIFDIDNMITVCQDCEYKYCHIGKCSTWELANLDCSSRKLDIRSKED